MLRDKFIIKILYLKCKKNYKQENKPEGEI